MRFLIFLCLFLTCSHGYSEEPNEDIDSFRNSFPHQYIETAKMIRFREDAKIVFVQDKDFFISCDEGKSIESSQNSCIPYKSIRIAIHLPKLEDKKTYILYCPNVGSPSHPELYLEVIKDGNDIFYFNADCIADTVSLNKAKLLTIDVNPGFCSDWYLISSEPDNIVHTSFAYKPIIVSLATGETVQIHKKEPGGNMAEIFLTNFPKNTKVSIESTSSPKHIFETDDQGYSVGIHLPSQHQDKTKGVDLIKILWDDRCLETSVDWDKSTLDVERVQPVSRLWTAFGF